MHEPSTKLIPLFLIAIISSAAELVRSYRLRCGGYRRAVVSGGVQTWGGARAAYQDCGAR
ncbi:hypothetical protein [Rugosibacter aromaticivorans]|uniref:hypothetical protein n=1 Tax=Rugosibacter aromaticivorans TaxID=1565605 RepID=UPI00192A56AB|nr:hypothetical protein [Rugosibacter aromaticivorans]